MSALLTLFAVLSQSIGQRLVLAKAPLSLLIGCSSLFGFILSRPIFTWAAFLTSAGVFTLAAGAASLNSLQDQQLDCEFLRTRNRPLPQGFVTPLQAAIQALILLILGLFLIYEASDTYLPLLVAVLAVIFYNGFYTPLKKRSIWAIIPGSICGALPPVIGWLSAGGELFDYIVALLMALFVLWQVPHFLLILLTHKEDYERSARPNLVQLFQEKRLKRLFVTWIGALVTVMLMFVLLPYSLDWICRAAIIVNCSILISVFLHGLVLKKISDYKRLFVVLNSALALHMLIFSVGRFVA